MQIVFVLCDCHTVIVLAVDLPKKIFGNKRMAGALKPTHDLGCKNQTPENSSVYIEKKLST